MAVSPGACLNRFHCHLQHIFLFLQPGTIVKKIKKKKRYKAKTSQIVILNAFKEMQIFRQKKKIKKGYL